MPRTIQIEEVARVPKPGMAAPGAISFRPDGRLLTYLHSPEGGLVRQLYAYDVEAAGEAFLLVAPPGGGATEENLSPEEKLRRERMRQHELGITAYAWSPKAGPGGYRLLIPFPDGLYAQEGSGPLGKNSVPLGKNSVPLRKLVDSANGPVLDPRFSPDGEWVAYVQNNELWVVPADGTGAPKQLTFGAGESGKTHGLAEYIAQEEMHRTQGYWWSPDSRLLAFEEVDETHIPVYRIIHQGKEAAGQGAERRIEQEDHRYPFAGQPNARVRLGVVSVEGAEPTWMDLGKDEDIYLARVRWMPGDAQSPAWLAAQVQNRAQTRLDLLGFDPAGGQCRPVLAEESPVWINLHNILHPLRQGQYAGSFLWASERTGFRHLYLYSRAGELLRALTSGEWMVDDLAGVDEANGMVYFTATLDSPLESHLYAVPLDNGKGMTAAPRRITPEPGMHQVVLDPTCMRFVDIHSSTRRPPSVTLRSLADGTPLAALYETRDPRIEGLEPPELVTLQSRDGVTLYGALYRPQNSAAGPGPYPTIVSVYGGPHAQQVQNAWKMTADMRAQYLRQQGFLVFVLDNRGSARRGLAFEGALRWNMGDVEVRDQVDGARWLIDQGLADPERVGVYGWSYGGFMAAMCLGRAPEVFKAAVAGAPVTHWDGYDTHYTERYMGTPQENPEGYQNGSVMHWVAGMRGRLMLVHGLIDENVHFRHTARLINALIAERKTYDLLLFPDERHSPRKLGDRVFMEEQIVEFFKKNL